MPLTAIDLFAGGGGLTVGLKRAGFEIISAVEIEKHASATYKANHPEVTFLEQDITTVSGERLKELTKGLGVDLMAGCPPCQGFTSLNKYGENDPRNELVLEMARLAKEVMPRAIMIENVPGLATKGKRLYDRLTEDLRLLGYILEETASVLQSADYGVPQRRRRLVLLAGLGFKIDIPPPTHSRSGKRGLPHWKSVRDAIGDAEARGAPLPLTSAQKQGALQKSNWHIVRTLSPQNVQRIRAAKPGTNWTNIPEEIRPECHKGNYMGFPNVYGRMEWDQPSPTITAGCTTFSKGRFGHPMEDRTISVREAALLQTFPENYRFDVPFMEHVCNVIGNALPCDLAEVLARQCHRRLEAFAEV